MSVDRTNMSEVSRTVKATPHRVFAELSDGWAYVGWVVGATHIRDVDAEWPDVGSRIHHQVGSWPAAISDTTEVLESEADRRLLLRAKGWPLGEATVEIVLTEQDGQCLVSLREAPSAGPGRWLDNPALRWMLKARNTETLSRLADRVEHRPIPE
ncbi:SRPBCC family protein [Jatrophihabitans telluris]|uniref:SRPBCC family protein n=1 Tax=Jatrophihabitans telluris TaxID=2038343 RepID=A0ABY4R1U8_9ACTN|nr:SRPBCC family protein [Jatrophihabitans telluris]UQX89437.1 SRPBCC family protein [Jatrophihabitans telluris]